MRCWGRDAGVGFGGPIFFILNCAVIVFISLPIFRTLLLTLDMLQCKSFFVLFIGY